MGEFTGGTDRGINRVIMLDQPSHDADLRFSPQTFARRFLPQYFRYEFNKMHCDSFQEYRRRHNQLLPGRKGCRLAIAAPRGSAKSTIHSLLLPLLDIIYQRERHIVIISATFQQAVLRLSSIIRELQNNVGLHGAFFGGRPPDMKGTRRSMIINDIRLDAYGCGAEIRGISHGEYRPTHIILDDVEASRNAFVPARRQQLLEWYDEVIENLGDNYTHITMVGTVLHRKSLLSQLLDRPNYRGKIYRSILRWSRRTDLWSVWRELYADLSDSDRERSADTYFRRNRRAMLEGTEVLWPEKESYADLQKLYLTIGRRAFAKEKQNSPFSNDHRVFDTQRWTRFIAPDKQIEIVKPKLAQFAAETGGGDPYEEADSHLDGEMAAVDYSMGGKRPLPHLDDLKYYGFLDPALGRKTSRDGDYAAIVTVGRDNFGTLYVVDVWMERATPSRQIARAFELHGQYNYTLFGYEANGFQETLGTAIARQSKISREAGKSSALPLRARQNMENKHARICCLEPAIIAGTIRFQNNLPDEFYNQADEFGHPGCHDDALDALASCVEMIRELHLGINGLKTIPRISHTAF